MFTHLTPLQVQAHSKLCLKPVNSYEFAKDENFIPIIIDEIGQVSREYPIVFHQGLSLPVALLGVEKGQNAYVLPNGRWDAHYIPGLLRQYPFAMRPIQQQDRAKQQTDDGGTPPERLHMAALIDTAASCLSETEGSPLFNADGSLSVTTQGMLRKIQRDTVRLAATRKLVASIVEASLLVERKITIRSAEGSARQIGGIYTIDEKALNRLDHASFTRLRDSGALPLIYASLLSWSNFKLGPIGRSHPLPKQMQPESESQGSFFESDTIRF